MPGRKMVSPICTPLLSRLIHLPCGWAQHRARTPAYSLSHSLGALFCRGFSSCAFFFSPSGPAGRMPVQHPASAFWLAAILVQALTADDLPLRQASSSQPSFTVGWRAQPALHKNINDDDCGSDFTQESNWWAATTSRNPSLAYYNAKPCAGRGEVSVPREGVGPGRHLEPPPVRRFGHA